MQPVENQKSLIFLTAAALLLFGLGAATGWLLHPAGSTETGHDGEPRSGTSTAGGLSSRGGHGAGAETHGASRSVLGQNSGSRSEPAQGQEPAPANAEVPSEPASPFDHHVKDWIVNEAFENNYRMPSVGHAKEDEFDVDEDFTEILDLNEEQAQELQNVLFTHHKTLRALQKAHAVYDDDPAYYGRVVFSPFEEEGKMLRQALMQDLHRILGPEKVEFFSEYMEDNFSGQFDHFGERQMVYCIKPDEEAGKWQVREERYEWDEHDKAWEQRGASWSTNDVGSELRWPYTEYFEIDPNVAELERQPE